MRNIPGHDVHYQDSIEGGVQSCSLGLQPRVSILIKPVVCILTYSILHTHARRAQYQRLPHTDSERVGSSNREERFSRSKDLQRMEFGDGEVKENVFGFDLDQLNTVRSSFAKSPYLGTTRAY